MQNKRGISQALSPVSAGFVIRRATVFDVFDISRVLIHSITRLCTVDHDDDPHKISLWTANKTPDDIRGWIISDRQIRVAEQAGEVVAVGGVRASAEVSLLYVDPNFVGQGGGSALLARLEAELIACGHDQAHLKATKTALGFYRKNGWDTAGNPSDWHGIPQFPLRKSLHRPD